MSASLVSTMVVRAFAPGSEKPDHWPGFGVSRVGRGERDSPATTDLPTTMRLAEPPEPFDWLRSA